MKKRGWSVALICALAVGCGGPLPEEPVREEPLDEGPSLGFVQEDEAAPSWEEVSAEWNRPKPALGPAFLVEEIFPPSEQDPEGGFRELGPQYLVDFRGTLFFVASFETAGATELWRSDGTAPGTFSILRLPGAQAMRDLTVAGDRLFFVVGDRELWVSDGTSAGTRRVDDAPGLIGWPRWGTPTSVGNTLFYFRTFPTSGDNFARVQLWKSDGTVSGTRLVRELGAGPVGGLTTVGRKVFFAFADAEYGSELWVSDGTPSGTRRVKDINPGAAHGVSGVLTPGDGYVYFSATDPEHGEELWRSDGTRKGTRLIADLVPGPEGSGVMPFTVFDERLYFTIRDPATQTLRLLKLRVDGTCRHRPVFLAELLGLFEADPDGTSTFIRTPIVTGGRLFFVIEIFDSEFRPAQGHLWVTNGTRHGTKRLSRTLLGSDERQIGTPAPVGDGRIVFGARDEEHGMEPWVSDGTPGGTRMLQDLEPRPGGSFPIEFTRSDGFIFFVAFTAEAGNELWALPLPRGRDRAAGR